jgi:hypothetical protein
MGSAHLDEELALMLLPSQGEAKRRHVAALADVLDVETWDAARMLECPLPQILRSAAASQLKPLAKALKKQGLPISALETSLLLEDIDEWVVEWLEYDDRGRLLMVGGEGSVPLLVNQETLMVRGWEMRRTSSFTSPSTSASGSLRKVQFAHLYVPDRPHPYCLVESEIRDYLFLEEEIAPSARQNFQRLVEILASAPYMRVEDAMLKHADHIRPALAGLRNRQATSASSAGLTLSMVPEHVLSRIYYYNTF